MVNVSKVRETELNTSYDVIILATAALETIFDLFRQSLSLSTGRVHTVIYMDRSE